MEELIRIRDKRKGVFVVDNVVMNGYGKMLGATGIALYVVLCRYANRDSQQAYPSLTLIQKETGMDRKTIISAARRAEELKLIKRNTKKGSYTVYTLLEPKKNNQCGFSTSKKTSVVFPPTGGNFTTTGGNSEENELRERMKNNEGLELLRKTVEGLRINP